MSSRVRQDEPPGRSRQRRIANLDETTSPNFRLNFRLAFLSFVYFGKQPLSAKRWSGGKRPAPDLLAEPRRPMALCRIRFGLCFGLGLASFAANTRQSSGEKAGGDIDFAAFYILPVPSSLSAKWRRVKIGSLHAAETHPPRPRPSARRGAAYGLGFVPMHDGVFKQRT